jgi:hypothetical protein
VAGRGQRLEQVALRDDVKASPGNRLQDRRVIDTACVVLAVPSGSEVVAGDRRQQIFTGPMPNMDT